MTLVLFSAKALQELLGSLKNLSGIRYYNNHFLMMREHFNSCVNFWKDLFFGPMNTFIFKSVYHLLVFIAYPCVCV